MLNKVFTGRPTIITTIAALILLGSGNFVFAQDYEYVKNKDGEKKKAPIIQKNHIIKSNPTTMLAGPIWVGGIIPVTGEFRLSYEAVSSSNTSFEIGVSYLGPSPVFNWENLVSQTNSEYRIQIDGYRFQGKYKYYPFEANVAPKGLYFAPVVSYSNAVIKGSSTTSQVVEEYNVTKWNFQAIGGYQMITKGGFTFDPFGGMGYKKYVWKYSLHDPNNRVNNSGGSPNIPGAEGLSLLLGFNLGYAF